MINAQFNENVIIDKKPLTWSRVIPFDYFGGFYFACPNKHLNLYPDPAFRVSNSKHQEGVVTKEIICKETACKFRSFVLLCDWKLDRH